MDPDLDDRSEIIEHLVREEGHDREAAEAIADAIEAESETDHGDVGELWDAIQNASGMIVDAAIELNSAVDVPAIDSKWVMFKSADKDGYNRQIDSRLVLKQDSDSDKRISYAPAMIPRTPDKEGEVVPTAVVEDSAHGYLKEGGGVDTDHNLIDGKGEVVESWIEPEEREWDLPGGGTETYPPGTWMLGVEWGQEAWERIQAGELTGLSIYGMAEQLQLSESDPSARAVLRSYSKMVRDLPEEFQGQFPDDWPFSAGEEGIEECKERMAGEVDDPEGFCFAWAEEAGIRERDAAETAETGRDIKTEPTQPNGREQTMGNESTPGDDGGDPDVGELLEEVREVKDTQEDVQDALSELNPDEIENERDIGELIDSVVRELADHDDVGMAAADLKDAIRSLVANEDMPDDEDEEEDEEEEFSLGVENSADDVSKETVVEWAADNFDVENEAAEKALEESELDISKDADELDLGSIHRFVDAVSDGVTAADTAAALSVLSGGESVSRSVDQVRWRKNFTGEEDARSSSVDERQQPTTGGVPSYQEAAAQEAEER